MKRKPNSLKIVDGSPASNEFVFDVNSFESLTIINLPFVVLSPDEHGAAEVVNLNFVTGFIIHPDGIIDIQFAQGMRILTIEQSQDFAEKIQAMSQSLKNLSRQG